MLLKAADLSSIKKLASFFALLVLFRTIKSERREFYVEVFGRTELFASLRILVLMIFSVILAKYIF
jgi:hypothetical protein